MKNILFTLALLVSFSSFGQNVKEFETEIEMDFDFGITAQKNWEEREKVLKDLESQKKNWDNLTKEELKLFEKYDQTYYSMWDVIGDGCSWYCGAGDYKVKTSSHLESQGDNSYEGNNISDFSYKTAWVEGKKGYGIGEFIEFSFVPEHPRITTIKIANGYVKSRKSWKNNSRVKKLKIFINDSIYGIINLKDVYSLQSIYLKNPVGYPPRDDFENFQSIPNWKIKFEILEVYKGDKYDDTVISEIFFDGIDVH